MSDVELRTAAADAGGTELETASWFSLGSDATTEVSNERIQPVYNAGSASQAALSATLSFTGPASTAVSHLLVWDAATDGTIRFAVELSGGDMAFNANGDLNLTAATITVS